MSVEMQINLLQWYAIDYLIITFWLLTNFAFIYELTSAFLTSNLCVLLEFQ